MNIWVLLPTYNEASNISALIGEILSVVPQSRVLVVDDDSPDGTSGIVARMAASDGRIHLVSRKGGRGRGRAGVEGFRCAISSGADFVVEMDADFSHQPRYIPELLNAARECGVSVASRWMTQAGICGRPAYRDILSLLARFVCRFFLGMRLSDPTSGFRCFSRRALESIDWDRIISTGPSIVGEIILLLQDKGFVFREVPIVFMERRSGRTKLNALKLLSALFAIFKVKFRLWAGI
jgi:dolichol-phosphate mannosyltransferase